MRRKIGLIIVCILAAATAFVEVGCKKKEPRQPRKLFVGYDYQSIQEAINAAERGDIITIKPAVYKERIKLKDGVAILGLSREKVILEADATEGPVVTIEGCKDVRLEKITVRQVGATDEM